MDSETYKELSARTLSDQFHTEIVHSNEVDKLFQAIISVGNWADGVKKGLFYGKTYTPRTNITGTSLKLDENFKDYLHGILGSFTEVVEMVEHLYAVMTGEKEFDRINACEEEADNLWYSALRWRFLNVTPENDLYEANINKLIKRYAEKFSTDEAINRDLSGERKILEAHHKVPESYRETSVE